MNITDRVRLRPVEPGDLPRVYELQLDPESNRMAVMTPRTREAFDSHWEQVLADPGTAARAILVGEETVGVISCFPRDGRDHVGYWVDRAHWGKGIAGAALSLLLREVDKRPLVATAATSNVASLRVLRKCGFVVEQVRLSPATDRHPACEEAVLVLREEGREGVPRGDRRPAGRAAPGQSISAVALVVNDYDEATRFFTHALGFEVVEDTPLTPGKRWVTVRPPGGGTAILLAKAVTPAQTARVGDQTGGRVFLFLRTDDFWRDYRAMRSRGVRFVEGPRDEEYGTVAVFLDLYGNRWDLVERRPPRAGAEPGDTDSDGG